MNSNQTMNDGRLLSSMELTDGEYAGLGIIEITSIPHVSILNKPREAAEEDTIISFTKMLTEAYQTYRQYSQSHHTLIDISLECLWITEAVINQPYSAGIRLFLIVRSIAETTGAALSKAAELISLCKSHLSMLKYEYEDRSFQQFYPVLSRVSEQKINAIMKEERVENLQNQLLPSVFAYDIFQLGDMDLSRLTNLLIHNPDCAVSFQLIPTSFSPEENLTLDSMTQVLGTLSRGVTEQGMGNISFALAEKHLETYKYYTNHKNDALFSFNILVYGTAQSVPGISTRLYGQLSGSRGKMVGVKYIELSPEHVQRDLNFYPLPWAIHEYLLQSSGYPASGGNVSGQSQRLPYIVTADEAAVFFRLPVGGDSVGAGLVINGSDKTSRAYTNQIINSSDIIVGRLKASQNDTIGFQLNDLTKHMLVVGTPGSGKTTFAVGLLDRLWKQHGIPFLVIEPAKNEYRALVQSIPDIQVFTPGKNSISPFVFNPFVPPRNVKLETYKSTLKTAFAAAVSMSTPLDKIFEESVNNCYSDFRWLDFYTNDGKGRIFNISDFIQCFRSTFDAIGYTGETKNIGRAGVVRLQSLANLFDHYYSIPIEDLLQKPTIIELNAIENSDQKALIIALLLLSILTYVNSNYVGEGALKNVLLLEEAHVLLDASTNAGEGEANPSAIAQSLIKRMLAEIRSYGVGMIIADQSPRKVTADVVAMTDIKLTFRLVEAGDKRMIADSTNMTEVQMQRLSRLKPGEAFLFFGKLDDPEEVYTENYRVDNNISITLSDEGIAGLSTYWEDKQDRLRPYPDCTFVQGCAATCDFETRLRAREIARRIFVKNFSSQSQDIESLKKVLSRISRLIRAELNDETMSERLRMCVVVNLLRKVRYDTGIKLNEETIRLTLKQGQVKANEH